MMTRLGFGATVIVTVVYGLFVASFSKAETLWHGENFGDWRFECGSRAEGVTQCALVQSVVDTVSNQIIVRLSFARSPTDGTVTASALLPLGVELSRNAIVRYGGDRLGLPFRLCVSDGCLARKDMAPDELRRVANAHTLSVEFFAVGRDAPLKAPASGRGLSEAFLRLGYVSLE